MSYIYNSCACEVCGAKIDYVWQLADGVFERVPDREKYVFAANKKFTQNMRFVLGALNAKLSRASNIHWMEST